MKWFDTEWNKEVLGTRCNEISLVFSEINKANRHCGCDRKPNENRKAKELVTLTLAASKLFLFVFPLFLFFLYFFLTFFFPFPQFKQKNSFKIMTFILGVKARAKDWANSCLMKIVPALAFSLLEYSIYWWRYLAIHAATTWSQRSERNKFPVKLTISEQLANRRSRWRRSKRRW